MPPPPSALLGVLPNYILIALIPVSFRKFGAFIFGDGGGPSDSSTEQMKIFVLIKVIK